MLLAPKDNSVSVKANFKSRNRLFWSVVLAMFYISSAQGQTLTTLYTFQNGADGGNPYAGLVLRGNDLYGTTLYGGTFGAPPCESGCGTVFRIDTAGEKMKSLDFNGANGARPLGGLITDQAGNLYGGTGKGGNLNRCYHAGCGTLFKIDHLTGQETLIHRFIGSDGGGPSGALVTDSSGNGYAVTDGGGDPSCNGGFGCGAVYRIDRRGRVTVLYAFNGINDGGFPEGNLIFDSAGNLYGTASGGPKCGGVFELGADGTFTMLHIFDGVDGCSPHGGLLRDSSGSLYGTTTAGGDLKCEPNESGCGVVFKFDKNDVFTTLHIFESGADGARPYSGLIADADGNLFGTTSEGGINDAGTIFELDRQGNETIIHIFDPGVDGGDPTAPLILDSGGNLYGTTYGEGVGLYPYGTIFKLTIR